MTIPRFLVVVKVQINKPYAFWKERFDQHAEARLADGIEDVFCAPVIGEQAILYGVRTDRPRDVLDMMYQPEALAHITESGHVVGSEEYTLCEVVE